MPDTLFIFVCLQNTKISLPRTRICFAAYAGKVRLTPRTTAKMTSARLSSGCMNMHVSSPRCWKMGHMLALTAFGGKHVNAVHIVLDEEEEGPVSPVF